MYMYMYLRLFFALPSSEEDASLSIGKLVYGLRVKNGSSTPRQDYIQCHMTGEPMSDSL